MRDVHIVRGLTLISNVIMSRWQMKKLSQVSMTTDVWTTTTNTLSTQNTLEPIHYYNRQLTTYDGIDIPEILYNILVNEYADHEECAQDINSIATNSDLIIQREEYIPGFVEKLSELSRTVQFSQGNCITIMSDITTMIDQFRSKWPFVINVTTFGNPRLCNYTGIYVVNGPGSTPASTDMTTMIGLRNIFLIEYNRSTNKFTQSVTLQEAKLLHNHLLLLLGIIHWIHLRNV